MAQRLYCRGVAPQHAGALTSLLQATDLDCSCLVAVMNVVAFMCCNSCPALHSLAPRTYEFHMLMVYASAKRVATAAEVPLLLLQDRVETSPEQMAACTALAEHISTTTGLFTRVVGWYHSHPHITVLPSHVDVSTQVRSQQQK